MARRRWQIELRPAEELALTKLAPFFGESESEAGREMLRVVSALADAIERGFVVSFLPAETATLDAFPQLTRALHPEQSYLYLAPSTHPWRRQWVIKGRRLTTGQLVGQLEANNWDAATAAEELDLPLQAVLEAIDYVSHHRALIDMEAAEERRRVEEKLARSGFVPPHAASA
jgi:uncharacterized protein (DUF433 family)